jgi:hypothetical protein
MIYSIYHIPGIKIGCSDNPKRRVRKQGYTEYTILETHTDINIAAEREFELQKEYGYKVDDVRYTERNYSTMGKAGGNASVIKDNLWKARNAFIAKYSKSIIVFDYKTNELKGTYTSLREAARELSLHRHCIRNVLTNKHTQHHGYTFKYA